MHGKLGCVGVTPSGSFLVHARNDVGALYFLERPAQGRSPSCIRRGMSGQVRRAGGRRSGRPAGGQDVTPMQMGFALGQLLVRPGHAIPQRYNRSDRHSWAGAGAVADWSKKEAAFFAKELKVNHGARNWMAGLTINSWHHILRQLGPVLSGCKDLAWAQDRFESRPGENMTRKNYVEQHTKCTAAKRILSHLIKDNPDATMPELYENWVVARRQNEREYPVLRTLPRTIARSTFWNWLSEIAYPRGSAATMKLTKGDLPARVEWCTEELSLPEHRTDALFRNNSLHRSLAADGFTYDHHDVARKHPTGYVLRQGSR